MMGTPDWGCPLEVGLGHDFVDLEGFPLALWWDGYHLHNISHLAFVLLVMRKKFARVPHPLPIYGVGDKSVYL